MDGGVVGGAQYAEPANLKPKRLRDVIYELNALHFSIASLIELFPHGSYARENASNIALGLKARLEALTREMQSIGEARIAQDVADKLSPVARGLSESPEQRQQILDLLKMQLAAEAMKKKNTLQWAVSDLMAKKAAP